MANKVKFGLKNVHFAVAHIGTTGAATYDTPVAWPGAVELSLDAEGETSKFYADNIAYAQFAANAGYSGSFTSALIPETFKTNVLGEVTDTAGVLYEDAGASAQPFALLFQFEGDDSATRHVLYNCVASRPSVSGSTTEDSIEAQTEEVEITCSSIFNATLNKDVVKARCPESVTTTYGAWFDAVYQA